MRRNYEKLFSHIKPAEPPAGLFGRVMDCIREERRLSAGRRRLAVFSLILLASAAAFVPVFRMAQADFSQSGFAQFFSLIFSDFGIVAAEWQTFSMSLLETLPAMSLAMLLAVIFIFLESFKFLARDIKFVSSPNRLTNN